jgi:hypothetical protein
MKLFIYTAIALFFAPCNASKKAASAKTDDYTKTQIVYERTACFGTCPIYTLTIDGATQMATFKGDQHTEKIGTYTKKISKEELKTWVDAFEKAKFNSLNDEYLGMITDFPIKYITYTHNGKTKKIKERSNAPKELTDLEKLLDAYADSGGWTKE